MYYKIAKCALLILLLIKISVNSYAYPGGRINPDLDLTYIGAFRIGTGVWQPGFGLSYNPEGNGGNGSLFVIKENYNSDANDFVFEISIATPKISDINELNRATVLHSADVTGGILPSIKKQVSQYYSMGDVQPYGGKLHWNIFVYYDVNWDTNSAINHYVSQGWSDITSWWTSPNARGTWHIHDTLVNPDGRYHGDYLAIADKEWADACIGGRYILEGRRRENGTYGPGLYAIAPWEDGNPPANGQNISYKALLRYGPQHPILGDAPNDTYRDAVWIKSGNNRALLFVGTKGTATNACYGGAECMDSCSSEHGFHSYPYAHRFYWYDPDDFAAVYLGAKNPWEPLPYSTSTPTVFYRQGSCPSELGGAAYDPIKNLLYVSEVGVDGDDSVVHVWQVASSNHGTISAPANLLIIK